MPPAVVAECSLMVGLVLGIFGGALPSLGDPADLHDGSDLGHRDADHLPRTHDLVLRAEIRTAGILRRLSPHLLLLRRHRLEAKHKTVISMVLSLLTAGVDMDPVSGTLRMTFGSTDLLRGINFLVAVIGLFGISEILLTIEERLALRGHAVKIIGRFDDGMAGRAVSAVTHAKAALNVYRRPPEYDDVFRRRRIIVATSV
jgi:hypothetical protein